MQIKVCDTVTNYCDYNPRADRVVLILHGWGHSNEIWRGVGEKISRKYRVIVPDLPAFGRSSPLPYFQGVESYVAWVRSLIKKMGISKVVLVGHSFGAQIAVLVAYEYPYLVDKVVLVAPALQRDRSGWEKHFMNILKILSGLRKWVPKSWRYFLTSGYDYGRATDEQKKIMRMILNTDVVGYLSGVRQSLLVVWGENDKELLGEGRVLMSKIPKAILKVIYNSGHNPQIEKENEFLRVVERFLR